MPVRPKRTPAGDAFTDFVLEVAWLGGIFTNIGEALAKRAGQTLARWVILDAIEEQPSTVAQIARRRGIARQAVQRVADLLERDGLAAYEQNPGHRRARLLRPTEKGRDALATISIAQKVWSDALGRDVGEPKLKQATDLVSEIRRAVQSGQSSPDAGVTEVLAGARARTRTTASKLAADRIVDHRKADRT